MSTEKRIVVTGASAGVGRAITAALLASGHRVLATGRSTRRLEVLRDQHSSSPDNDRLSTLSANLSTDAGLADLMSAVDEFLGSRIDGFVHAAFGHIGEDEGKSLQDVSAEDLRTFIDESVTATALAVQAVAPTVRTSAGRFVFIVADWGLPQHNVVLSGESADGPIGSAAFVAGKFFEAGLASSLERDSAVQVSAIYPGVIASWAGEGPDGEPDFLALDSTHAEVEEAGYSVPQDAIPLEDIARTVEYCLTTSATPRTVVLKPTNPMYIGL